MRKEGESALRNASTKSSAMSPSERQQCEASENGAETIQRDVMAYASFFFLFLFSSSFFFQNSIDKVFFSLFSFPQDTIDFIDFIHFP